jgi:hypothetical protein
MPKAALISALCGFALAGGAIAQTAATVSSNIALSEYPGPSCTKPRAPVKPIPAENLHQDTPAAAVSVTSQNDARVREADNTRVEQYNKAVAAYNTALKEFDSCMQAYVENGNADMTRIKQKLDAAVAAANAR